MMNEKDNKKVKIICSDPEYYGKRVDLFLSAVLEGRSRSYLQKLIEDKHILVNGKDIKSSYLVKPHDEIEITFPQPPVSELIPQKVDFEVVDIQPDFLVINKPAGLVVHQAHRGEERATLVHGLLFSFQEFAQFSDDERPGIVHRLDKDTSGLMIVARNPSAQAELSKLFKDRKISKTYLAVVQGEPPAQGKIDFSIGRHPREGHKMSHMGINSRDALTYFETLVYYKGAALVCANPVTGRTHQIRVHLASIGFGILGDSVYGYQSKLISRQALHAWKLSFEFKSKQFTYRCSVPSDFKNLLRNLLKKSS